MGVYNVLAKHHEVMLNLRLGPRNASKDVSKVSAIIRSNLENQLKLQHILYIYATRKSHRKCIESGRLEWIPGSTVS
jgi:hypothetical protein